MTKISVLRPDVTDAPPAAVTLAPRARTAGRPVIGLIANGKPLARELLDVLADEIARGSAARRPRVAREARAPRP